MGTLTFSEIETRPLVSGLGLVTGRYELKRTAAVGGPGPGTFYLNRCARARTDGKIIYDSTSTD